jgi:hypothetical protein
MRLRPGAIPRAAGLVIEALGTHPLHMQEQSMKISFTSPLEFLAAFAIAFGAGAVSTAAVGAYVEWIKRNPARR